MSSPTYPIYIVTTATIAHSRVYSIHQELEAAKRIAAKDPQHREVVVIDPDADLVPMLALSCDEGDTMLGPCDRCGEKHVDHSLRREGESFTVCDDCREVIG